ncbi:hypothetical protein AB0H57_22375 [Micromonospora sp. NPDC050686]|uniref:hypothetical protein n=1 Tax=Micromonospora sp. NPDC050686 TaxID=3154631 RepID=UPI0033DD0ADA
MSTLSTSPGTVAWAVVSASGTVGTLDPDNVPPPGQASVAPRRGLAVGQPTPNAVYVQPYNSAGTPANLGFHLVVHS